MTKTHSTVFLLNRAFKLFLGFFGLWTLLIQPAVALSAPTCHDLFQNSQNQEILNTLEVLQYETQSKPYLSRLLEHQYKLQLSERFEDFEDLTAKQKLEVVKNETKKLRIEYQSDILVDKQIEREVLYITPKKNGSELNRLAFILREKLNLNLIYNPSYLDRGIEAYFQPKTMEIGLPHITMLSGHPSVAVYHEIRHASLLSKVKKGRPTIFEGHVISTGLNEEVDHLYEDFLSFQEISTYFQDANFHYLAVTQPSFKSLRNYEMNFMLKASKEYIKLSRSVISFALQKLNKAEELVLTHQSQVKFKKTKNILLHLGISHPNYEYYFTLPLEESFQSQKVESLFLEHIQKIKTDISKKLKRIDEMQTNLEKIKL
jgi:hypothetical protein